MALRRRKINPRGLEGIGKGYRGLRRVRVVVRKKKKGGGKDTMDSLD